MTDLKAHLKAKTENQRQLSLDLKQARENLSTKRTESRQAAEKLGIAESEFKKQKFPQPRASTQERLTEMNAKRGVAIFAKDFWVSYPKISKNYATAMPSAAPAVLVTRSLPNKG